MNKLFVKTICWAPNRSLFKMIEWGLQSGILTTEDLRLINDAQEEDQCDEMRRWEEYENI